MMTRRAFTLVELAVTMVIAGLVGIAAISLYSGVIRAFARARMHDELTARSNRAVNYLLEELENVGGYGIPPYGAIFVEDAADERGDFPAGSTSVVQCAAGSACGKPDRLTVIKALDEATCPITALDAIGTSASAHGTVQFVIPVAAPNGALDPGEFAIDKTCCYPPGHFRRTAVFVKHCSDGNPTSGDGCDATTRSRPVLLTHDSADCTFTWEDIVPPQMRTSLVDLDEVEAVFGSTVAAIGPKSVLVDFWTIYLDEEQHRLVAHADLDGSGTTANGYFNDPASTSLERFTILENVYDFQVSLGIDITENGVIDEATQGLADDWLFNAPNDTGPLTTFPWSVATDITQSPPGTCPAGLTVDPTPGSDRCMESGTFSYADLDVVEENLMLLPAVGIRVPLRMVQIHTVVGTHTPGSGTRSRVSSPFRHGAPIWVNDWTLRSTGGRVAFKDIHGSSGPIRLITTSVQRF